MKIEKVLQTIVALDAGAHMWNAGNSNRTVNMR